MPSSDKPGTSSACNLLHLTRERCCKGTEELTLCYSLPDEVGLAATEGLPCSSDLVSQN